MSNIAKVWCQKGNQYLEQQQYETAIKCYDLALASDPEHAESKANKFLACKARAEELLSQKDNRLALEYYKDALLIQPDDKNSLLQQKKLLELTQSEDVYKTEKKKYLTANNLQTSSSKNTALNYLSSIAGPIDMAALSYDVYFVDPNHDSKDVRYPLPSGWTLFDSYFDKITEYGGALYIKDADHPRGPTCLAWAHIGTNLKNKVDLLADLEIILQTYFRTLHLKAKSLETFRAQACARIIEKYGEKIRHSAWITTGHSLGSIFSDLLAAWSYGDKEHFTPLTGQHYASVTFENPGSKFIVEQYFKSLQLPEKETTALLNITKAVCTTYLARINAINSYGEQLGTSYELPLPYNYNVLNNTLAIISADYRLNLNYWFYTLLDQHRMSSILNHIKTSNEAPWGCKYPVGLANGYAEYLSPASITAKYWTNYALEIWNRMPELHSRYDNRFNNYLVEFQQGLIKTWEEAKLIASTASPAQLLTQVGTFKMAPKVNADDAITNAVLQPTTPEKLPDNSTNYTR